MNNKLKIIMALIFIINATFAQNNGILLSNKTNDETEFFKENKRVKIITSNGKQHRGRIQIIDEKTIKMRNEIIQIDSIVNIKSQSLFSTISATVVLVFAIQVIILGVVAGGYALIVVPFGALAVGVGVLIPTIGNHYKKDKWNIEFVLNFNQ